MAHSRLTRRAFLRRGAAGAALAPLAAHALAETPAPPAGPFRLRHVLASSLYISATLAEVVPEVRRAGMDALDIWPPKWVPHRKQLDDMGIEAFAELLKKHGARLAYTSRYDIGQNIAAEVPIVKKLGGTAVVTGTIPADEAAIPALLERLKAPLAAAEEHGITLAIENHGASPDTIRAFAAAAPPRVGIMLAPYHLPQDPAMIADLIKALGRRLTSIYLWQKGPGTQQLPGVGKLDFTPILAALKAIRYEGWCEIFMHGKVADTVEGVTQTVVRAREYIEGCLAKT
jgi:sugar phosphate isomerase/epimerase